jgi:hypothetical protein
VWFSRLRNQNFTSIEIQEKIEDLCEKLKNPCLKNFSGVTGHKLAPREVEESQEFPKVKHSKYQNGFLAMDSLD